MKFRTQHKLAAVLATIAAAGAAGEARAQSTDCTPSRLMVVLDKSSSMNDPIPTSDMPKWQAAVDALGEVANVYQNDIQLGLDVFPAGDGECSTGQVMVAPQFGNQGAIADALTEPPPDGGFWTPMSQTLDAVALDPSLADPGVDPFVVLITDGWQYCIPYDTSTRFDPVESIGRLNDAGITTFVVGFGDGVDVVTLNMMADLAGTSIPGCDPTSTTPDSGTNCYYQADSPADLVAALMDVAQQASADEICDGIDNDCDGEIDEDLVRSCATDCGEGSSVCENGEWTTCDAPLPQAEVCDGTDNDCDGRADEVDADEDPLCGPDEFCDGHCVPNIDPDAPSGCGCQSSTGGGLGALAMMLPLLIAFRRRRRRRG